MAPPIRLDNYLGEPVSLKEYKGKAVLITFIYTHCPDTCPLIVSHLKTAFVDDHGMAGRMNYLIGSRAELRPVWQDWNIIAKPAGGGRDRVGHSALIYGVGADGKVTTLYPANFKPAELAHDVPLLAEA